MDSTDLKIVSMLKKNARASASSIAKEVGLAVSSVTERIRRLETTGVILQYTALVDDSLIEGGVTALVGIKVRPITFLDSLVDILSADPRVVSTYMVTGDVDYFAMVHTVSTEEFRKVHSMIRGLEGVVDVKTYYIIGTYNRGESLPE